MESTHCIQKVESTICGVPTASEEGVWIVDTAHIMLPLVYVPVTLFPRNTIVICYRQEENRVL